MRWCSLTCIPWYGAFTKWLNHWSISISAPHNLHFILPFIKLFVEKVKSNVCNPFNPDPLFPFFAFWKQAQHHRERSWAEAKGLGSDDQAAGQFCTFFLFWFRFCKPLKVVGFEPCAFGTQHLPELAIWPSHHEDPWVQMIFPLILSANWKQLYNLLPFFPFWNKLNTTERGAAEVRLKALQRLLNKPEAS